ncbi:MAG: DUF1834 family protein [Syntrophus sp. (in: bacteria)]|nr:DUF1834 family protein [Syntrophus sp. (in: bacteria)]
MAVNYQDYDPETIEQAAIAAVQSLKTAGTVRTLEPYGGQLSVEEIEEITPLFPAIFVIWGGAEVREHNRADGAGTALTFIVADKNLRGTDAARRGATSSEAPGVYSLLKSIRGLVHGKTLVAGWYPARVIREAPMAYDPQGGIAIYEAVYEMKTRT